MEQNKASTPRQNEDGEQYIETNRRSARRERLDEQIKEAMRQIAQEEVGRAIEYGPI
jgi:crotonobetainyl-CoA:carnitine CoA-transferase CaiB-like acyl-CoA transferase